MRRLKYEESSQKTPMREGNSGFLLGRTDIGMVAAR